MPSSIDFADLLSTGRVFLGGASLCLLWGSNISAACFSGAAVWVLINSTKTSTTKDVEKWMILGCLSTFGSLVSLVALATARGQESEWFKMWFFGRLVQKSIGIIVAHYIYTDMRVDQKEPDDVVRFLEVKVTILRGRDLVPKDKNIWGRHYSSDPYVVLHHGPNCLGKTSIIKKTLDPVWENQSFRLPVVPRALEVYKEIELSVFDHDNLSSDDPMGTVFVPIPAQRNFKEVYWYPVEKGEGENYCRNATGDLLVEVEVRSQLAKSFKMQLRSRSERFLDVNSEDADK